MGQDYRDLSENVWQYGVKLTHGSHRIFGMMHGYLVTIKTITVSPFRTWRSHPAKLLSFW